MNTALTTPLADAAPDLSTGAELLHLSLSLVAVIGLIFLAGWLSRKLQGGRTGRGARRLRCLEVLSLGPRERVLLLEVEGRRLVVGSGAGGLRTLWTGDAPVPAADTAADDASEEAMTHPEVNPSSPGLFRTLLDHQRWKCP